MPIKGRRVFRGGGILGGSVIVNLLSNGDFELPGVPAAPTNWTGFNSAILTTVADPRTGSSGAAALDLENGAAASGYCQQNVVALGQAVVNGQKVTVKAWCKRIDTNPLVRIVDNTGLLATGTTSNTTWTMVTVTATIVDASAVVVRLQNTNSSSGLSSRCDDIIFYIG